MAKMVHRKYRKIIRHLDVIRDDLYGCIADGRGGDEAMILEVVDALKEVYVALDEVFDIQEPRPPSRDHG